MIHSENDEPPLPTKDQQDAAKATLAGVFWAPADPTALKGSTEERSEIAPGDVQPTVKRTKNFGVPGGRGEPWGKLMKRRK